MLSIQHDGQTSSKNATFGKVGLSKKITPVNITEHMTIPMEATSPQIMSQHTRMFSDSSVLASNDNFNTI